MICRKFLTTAEIEVNIDLMAEIVRLVSKIDRWWVREVEIPTNADCDGEEITDEEIISGRMIILQIMLRILTGEDSTVLWEMYCANASSSR